MSFKSRNTNNLNATSRPIRLHARRCRGFFRTQLWKVHPAPSQFFYPPLHHRPAGKRHRCQTGRVSAFRPRVYTGPVAALALHVPLGNVEESGFYPFPGYGGEVGITEERLADDVDAVV